MIRKILLANILCGAFIFLGLSCESSSKPQPQGEKETTASKEFVQMISKTEFAQKVFALDGSGKFLGTRPAVIDFYATWCGPCKIVAPIMEQLAKKYDNQVDFYKIDIDKERDLAEAFQIQSIPTIFFINKEGKVEVIQGANSLDFFEQYVQKILS